MKLTRDKIKSIIGDRFKTAILIRNTHNVDITDLWDDNSKVIKEIFQPVEYSNNLEKNQCYLYFQPDKIYIGW